MTDSRLTCDKCDKPAVVNYQETWYRHGIDGNGNYDQEGKRIDVNDTSDEYLCEEHDD